MGRFLDPDSPLRQHYEAVAKNLFSSRDGRSGSVVVTAPEQGTGRSSVCVGIAGAAAGMGRRVAIVDCNLRRPHLHHLLGEPNFVGLSSALEGEKPLEHFGHEILPGLLTVPTGPTPAGSDSLLESDKFIEVIHGLQKERDLVLLDAPVVDRLLDSRALAGAFDGILLIVHASRTPKSLAREATENLSEAGANLVGVVLNGYTENSES